MNLRHVLLLLALAAGFPGTDASAQSATLVAVEENGPRSQRINLVFLSEGYTTAELPNFAGHVNGAIQFLFSKEPWKQYRSYCNVYRIEIASNQSGCDNGNTSGAGVVRDTYFNSGFNTPSVPQLLTLPSSGITRAFNLLNAHVPEYDVPIVLVNDTKYGGAGGSLAVASVNGSSAAIVEHEIGHSFALLADEYDIEYTIYTPSERPNNTAQTSRALIRWNHWIDPATTLPTPEVPANDSIVGLFEGSMYRTSGWYRPHNNSLMRNLNRPCGEVNREQFVLRYYANVSPIENFAPAVTTRNVTARELLQFSVTPKIPSEGPALETRWTINGEPQAGAVSSSFSINSETLGDGTHQITATVKDPTTFVRLDSGNLLEDSVTWSFTLSNQEPNDLLSWRVIHGADEENPSGDGLNNLMKYALGLDPANPAAASELPSIATSPDGGASYLTLTVPRQSERSDVDYVVEVSPDLVTWQSGAGHTVMLEATATRLIVRDAIPLTGGAKRFIRLRIHPR